MSHKKLRAVQEEARALIRDSIVEYAISRFIAQILEVAAQHNADRIAALEADLARVEAKLAEARADGLREAIAEGMRIATVVPVEQVPTAINVFLARAAELEKANE